MAGSYDATRQLMQRLQRRASGYTGSVFLTLTELLYLRRAADRVGNTDAAALATEYVDRYLDWRPRRGVHVQDRGYCLVFHEAVKADRKRAREAAAEAG